MPRLSMVWKTEVLPVACNYYKKLLYTLYSLYFLLGLCCNNSVICYLSVRTSKWLDVSSLNINYCKLYIAVCLPTNIQKNKKDKMP